MDTIGEERVDAAGGVADDGDGAGAFKPKRTGALLAVIAALGLVAAGISFFLLRETPEPLRVLVAVDADGQWWDGSVTAAALVDHVVPHLKSHGFDVVDGGDAAVLEKLAGAATPEEAARRAGASFIVTGPVKVQVTELGKDIGMTEVRADGVLQLAHVEGGTKPIGEVHTWAGAPEKAEALRLAARSLGWQTFDVLLPGLMAHDKVVAVAKGSDAIAAGKLTAAKTYLEKRSSQLDFARSAYAELAQRFKAADQSPSKITLHTPLTRQDGLCALGASGFFAKSSAIRPFYSPERQALAYFLELERLFWQGADGKQRTVFEGYNVYGYASASPDGTTAAYVEDLYGAGTALHAVQGNAPSRRVFLDPKLRLSEPKVAPGGKVAVVWARSCARCPAAALVVDLVSGKEVYRSDIARDALGGFAWLGPSRLGLLLRSAAAGGGDGEDDEAVAPAQRLEAVDLSLTPAQATVLGSVSGDAKLTLPTASGDGARVVFSRYADDGMHLALYDGATQRLEPLGVEQAHEPAIAPAGDKIAFMRGGDLAIYDIQSQKTQTLTETGNDFSLRYPQFSLDGKAVYFEVRAKDPVFPKERSLAAIASVPVP